ncbi:MAG: hypothetical protein RIB03_05065 [Henriciella sp.]|uniref:hypothetical protein n=1 Tax=Henriciella sp. TaxID=1968823 RepID=UPI0032ED7020
MLTRFVLSAAALAALSLPAHAQTKTGILQASCQVNGQPAQMSLQYEAIGGTGITTGPGPNPDITGVISDGSVTYYWGGVLTGSFGTLQLSGENNFLKFYDPNVYNRETVLEITMTSDTTFYMTDVYGNYPGQHPCQITAMN